MSPKLKKILSFLFILLSVSAVLIIAFSNYFADRFAAAKKACHIRESSAGYHIFMVVRTFIITMIGNYVDLTHSFSDMFRMMRKENNSLTITETM